MIEKKIIHLLVLGLIIKIIIGGFLPLSPDEAYYWIWSHHLQLSYFDHPPFVSWLFFMGQPFEALHAFVRIPGMMLSQLTILLWIILLKGHLSQKQLFTFAALSQLMPFLGPAGLIITPDTPMMFFWVATLLCMKHLVTSKQLKYAAFMGVCFGLGFCSKYPIVLILPVLFYWLWKSEGLTARSLQWIGVAVAGSIVFSFPVWFWNFTNDLQSFGFQLDHGFGGGFQPKYLLHYVSAQIGLIFPTILYFAWKARREAPQWLIAAAVFPLGFFAVSSLFSYAEANWPIAAHPAFLAIACYSITDSRWSKVTGFLWAGVLTLVLTEAFFSWIPAKNIRLKTRVLHKYDEVAKSVKELSPVYARTYQMASMISFLNQSPVYKLKGMNRRDFFDSLPQSTPSQREFYLVLKQNEMLPKHLQTEYTLLRREPIDESFDLVMVMRGDK